MYDFSSAAGTAAPCRVEAMCKSNIANALAVLTRHLYACAATQARCYIDMTGSTGDQS